MTPPRTTKKPPEDAPANAEGVAVPVTHYTAGNARKAVAVAGLLVRRPELRGATLTPAEWDAALDQYLKTPIKD